MGKIASLTVVLTASLLLSCLLIVSLKLAFVYLLAIPFIVLIVLDYRYGLYLTILTFPIGRAFSLGGLNFMLYEIIIVLTTASFAIRSLINHKKILISNYYDIYILLFTALLMFNALFISIEPMKSLLYSAHFFEAFALFYMTLYLVNDSPEELNRIVNVIIFTAFIQSFMGIIQHFTGWGAGMLSNRGYLGILHITSGQVWHAAGTFGAFNVLAAYLGAVICLMLPNVMNTKNKLYKFIFLMILSCFTFTYSRGALLGTTAGCLLIFYKKLARKYFIIIFLLFVVMAGILSIKASSNQTYLKTVGYEGGGGRLEIWKRPWSVISSNYKNLILGTGSNTYQKIIPYPPDVLPEEQGRWFAHNNHLLLWQEFGLSGLTLFFIFFLLIIGRNFLRQKNVPEYLCNIKISMAAIVVMTIIHGYFDHQFSLIHARDLFFIVLALSETKQYERVALTKPDH